MNDKAIGLYVVSRIFLPEEIFIDDANEILIDIENHIGDYMNEKYGAVTGGSGKLLHSKEIA